MQSKESWEGEAPLKSRAERLALICCCCSSSGFSLCKIVKLLHQLNLILQTLYSLTPEKNVFVALSLIQASLSAPSSPKSD